MHHEGGPAHLGSRKPPLSSARGCLRRGRPHAISSAPTLPPPTTDQPKGIPWLALVVRAQSIGVPMFAGSGRSLYRRTSAPCLPFRVVLVNGRHERKPGGLHDVGGRCPDRDPAARQLDLELDLADRLAAGAH